MMRTNEIAWLREPAWYMQSHCLTQAYKCKGDSTLKAVPHLLSTAPKMSTALAPKLRIAEVRVTNKVGIMTSAHCLQKPCALPGDEEG